MSFKPQNQTQNAIDETDAKKPSEDQSLFNSQNMQFTAFFEGNISSKSRSSGCNEFDQNFFAKKMNSQQRRKSEGDNKLSKIFHYSHAQSDAFKIAKQPSLIASNDFYAKYHSNSATVHNYGNFILKSDFQSSNQQGDLLINNNRRQNDNLLLKYYGTGSNLLRANSGTNTNSFAEKYIGDLMDISSQSADESEDDSGLDSSKRGFKKEQGFYITNGKQEVFNLNYINNSPKNNLINTNYINNNSKTNQDNDNNTFKGIEFGFINEEDIDNLLKNEDNEKDDIQLMMQNFNVNNSLNDNEDQINNKLNGQINQNCNKVDIENIITKIGNQDRELIDNSPSLIQDQSGCRLLQKKIDENPPIADILFEKLYSYIIAICTDSFGNYLVQKIIENLSSDYLSKFTELVSSKFSSVAISTYGTRVIQRLIEVISKKFDIEIISKSFEMINTLIIDDLVKLSSDSNSSHIIIKYVNVIKYPKNISLFEGAYQNFVALSKDKHGCCVVQKCIEAGNDDQKQKLFNLSNIHCRELIADQFGNYVIQYVVGINNQEINKYVVNVIMKELVLLCKEKYASNVIEKFLQNKSTYSKIVIDAIIKDENILHELMLDQYGNYIIQRILTIVSGELKTQVIQQIVNWYDEIKMLTFGARLIAKLSERYNEFNLLVRKKYFNSNGNFNNNSNVGNVNFNHMNNYLFQMNNPMGMYMNMNMMNSGMGQNKKMFNHFGQQRMFPQFHNYWNFQNNQ